MSAPRRPTGPAGTRSGGTTATRSRASRSAASRRPGEGRAKAQRATYRGVRWRRDVDGTIGWYNDGIGRWVRWWPGSDAPPVPPRWADAVVGRPSMGRPRWRSPYRIVPVVLVVAVVVVGVVQALRSQSNPVKAETRTAEKLVGKCLAANGTQGGHTAYKSTPVPCSLPVADVKVVKVLPGTPGGPRCPEGTMAVQLAYPGVRYPHVECVTRVHSS